MFNISKTSEVKENVEDLVDSVKETAADIGAETKQGFEKVRTHVREQTDSTKDEIESLLVNLRELIIGKQPEVSRKSTEIKELVVDQINEWKELVQQEIASTLRQSKIQSRKALRDQPILSLAVAVGAGALIGYVIGHRQYEDR